MELLIVDDNSTDGSLAQIQALAAKDMTVVLKILKYTF